MSWQDRQREAACISPEGTRFVFLFEDVSETYDRKTTSFEFPDFNGTYVQDLGNTGRKYPLVIIFNGDDYDIIANAFMDAMSESGDTQLEHPVYGVKKVIPFGSITRVDRVTTAGNEAKITITFWENSGIIFPDAQQNPASQVVSAVDEYNIASSEQLEGAIELDDATDSVSFRNTYQSLVDGIGNALEPIAAATEEVEQQFNSILRSINEGIETAIQDPLTLAFQASILLQAPSRAIALISDKLQAYGNLASSIIGGSSNTQALLQQSNVARISNDFHLRDLMASSAVTGSILSVVNNNFLTKTDALQAADLILSQFEAVRTWREDQFTDLDQIDTGESYQQLLKSTAIAAGFLVQISFSLRQEMRITLDRNRTIIDLCAQLYGVIDSELDFFILTNNLSGSEILELPAGKEIVYFV